MRAGIRPAILAVLTILAAGCAGHPAPAPTRTYLALPAVDDMEGVVRWLELQRSVAIQVDGLDPSSAEVRDLDAKILAATESWAGEEREALAAERKMLVTDQGLGSRHPRIVDLDRAIAAADERLARARDRTLLEP